MIKKNGIDIRNGNWLFFDNRLLTIEECDPDEFERILTLGRDAIIAAAADLYTKTVNKSPQGARIYHPQTWAIKLTDHADTFTHGLIPEAQELTHDTLSDDDYSREFVRPEHWPYLDAAIEAGFAPTVPGRIQGWDQRHDGLWIRVQDKEVYKTEHSDAITHKSVGDSTRWPTTREEAEGIIPQDTPRE